jgi:8-oxo-dGTP pyrophosphatase MutT (NUDIX family)/phosphohistidine phosphatase SixA
VNHRSSRARRGRARKSSGRKTGPGPTHPGPVELAAGALCWRPAAGGGLELLIVRSARWGDWSWPKGKLDPGETRPECAVREVAEETGAQIELGIPLPSVSYVLPDGRDKSVSYWAARVRETGRPSATAEEISDVAWLPVEALRERLTRPSDLVPLDALLEADQLGRLDTYPVLVVRHAKARSRAHWPGGEADRPLTSAGRRQAQGLAGLLACWQPERTLTSPWARCRQTLRPYLDLLDQLDRRTTDPEVLELLSEQGYRDDPGLIAATIEKLLADGDRRSVLLCTHRPVLPAVVAALAEAADEAVRGQLPEGDPWLAPAEVLVAHVCRDQRQSVTQRIHSVEQHRGESPRNNPR